MSDITRTCLQCGDNFTVQPKTANRLGKGLFCSKGCATKYRHSQNGYGQVEFECRYCNKKFLLEGWRARKEGKGKFCSKECFTASRQKTSVCIVCQKEYTLSGWRMRYDRKCCSAECASTYRGKIYRGSNHIHWKGGISLYPPEWTDKFRLSIRKRDNFHCVVCGKYERGLAVHHIDADKNNTTQENCISLCRVCHTKVHAVKRAETWKVLLSVAVKIRLGWVEAPGE